MMYCMFSKRGDLMKKNTKKMLTMAAIMGVGAVSYMMYKKNNPEAIEDMKMMAKEKASKMLTKLENMD